MATFHSRRSKRTGKLRYRAQVRVKGYPTQSATFERKSDAREWAESLERAIKEGRYVTTAEAMRHTLGELVDRYIENVAPHKGTRTADKYTMQLNWWKNQVGTFKLSEVTPALIAEQRDKLVKGTTPQGKQRSPGTANRYLAALSAAYTEAVKEWGWAESNPVRRVRRFPESTGRDRVLSDDEREALLTECRNSLDRRLYPLTYLALSTGARQAELLRLKWQDVHLDRQMAILHHTKTGEKRALPLAQGVVEILQEMKKDAPFNGFVFVGPRFKPTDKRPYPAFPREAWDRALREANIEGFTFHGCRHCAATWLAENGATLPELAAVLGHKTLAMVKRYQHLTEQTTLTVVERMNQAKFGSVG